MRNDKVNWAPQGEYLSGVDYQGATFRAIESIGLLIHKPTGRTIAVYRPIPRLQRLMLRWCFGLRYEKIKAPK